MSFKYLSMPMGYMLHLDFKNWPCRPLKFKSQEPQSCNLCEVNDSDWDIRKYEYTTHANSACGYLMHILLKKKKKKG